MRSCSTQRRIREARSGAPSVGGAIGTVSQLDAHSQSRRTRVGTQRRTPERSRAVHSRLREHCPMLDHISIQCADLRRERCLLRRNPRDDRRAENHGLRRGHRIRRPTDARLLARKQTTGQGFRESHIAFSAPDRATVDAFIEAAKQAGAEVLHPPRVWPEYHANYYGGFVRDQTATTSKRCVTSASSRPLRPRCNLNVLERLAARSRADLRCFVVVVRPGICSGRAGSSA